MQYITKTYRYTGMDNPITCIFGVQKKGKMYTSVRTPHIYFRAKSIAEYTFDVPQIQESSMLDIKERCFRHQNDNDHSLDFLEIENELKRIFGNQIKVFQYLTSIESILNTQNIEVYSKEDLSWCFGSSNIETVKNIQKNIFFMPFRFSTECILRRRTTIVYFFKYKDIIICHV